MTRSSYHYLIIPLSVFPSFIHIFFAALYIPHIISTHHIYTFIYFIYVRCIFTWLNTSISNDQIQYTRAPNRHFISSFYSRTNFQYTGNWGSTFRVQLRKPPTRSTTSIPLFSESTAAERSASAANWESFPNRQTKTTKEFAFWLDPSCEWVRDDWNDVGDATISDKGVSLSSDQ